MRERADSQFVTEFCGPLDNGQRSTKFWLPLDLFSHVCAQSLHVAIVGVACAQVGPAEFCWFFSGPGCTPEDSRDLQVTSRARMHCKFFDSESIAKTENCIIADARTR